VKLHLRGLGMAWLTSCHGNASTASVSVKTAGVWLLWLDIISMPTSHRGWVVARIVQL